MSPTTSGYHIVMAHLYVSLKCAIAIGTLFLSTSTMVSAQSNELCDTVKYTFQKATGTQALTLNNTFSATSVAQYFDAPQELTVNGVTFYAGKTDLSGGLTVSVNVEIYAAGPDSLPMGMPLAMTTVSVDTTGALNFLTSKREVAFDTPITIDAPYLVVISNPSSNGLALYFNSYTSADGAGEYLSSVDIFGTWIRGYGITVAGLPLDADALIYPWVCSEIESDFTLTPLFDPVTNTVTLSANSSPILDSRMYNLASYTGQRLLSTIIDWGDGTLPLNDTMASHTYSGPGTQMITLSDTLFGYTGKSNSSRQKNWNDCGNYVDRVYVDAAVVGGNQDGTSWANATPSLSAGLLIARTCGVDSILVAQGAYKPTDSLGVVSADPRHHSFTLPTSAVMLGGFSPAHGVDLLSERNWELYPTLLNGDLDGNDLVTYPSVFELNDVAERSDNVYHIINQQDMTLNNSAVIDGFTFVGGNANAPNTNTIGTRGGAIYLQNSQPTISNCNFYYNAADSDGGAIFIDSLSSIDGFNLEFTQNYSGAAGGAIASIGDITLNECRFTQNRSNQGGAISSEPTESFLSSVGGTTSTPVARNLKKAPEDYNLPSLIIHNSIFSRDSADTGGAISALITDVKIDSSLFSENTAESFGGAVSAFFGTYIGNTNTFENNIAGFSGGALDLNGILFFEGGGFFFGGGVADVMSPKLKKSARLKSGMVPSPIDLIQASDASIVNSEFYNNSAGFFGGGISWFGDSLIIKSVIAESNCAAGFGGALNTSGNYANVDSSTFSQNQAGTGGSIHQFGCIQCIVDSGDPDPLEFNYEMNISHSSFSGDSAIIGGSIGVSFGDVTLIANEFNSNSADEGGGAIAALSSSYHGIQNTFTNNNSGFAGGAVAVLNGEEFFLGGVPFPALFIGPIEDCGPGGFGGPFAPLTSDKESSKKNAKAMMPEFNLNVYITDEVYTNNNSSDYGGAIYWTGDSLSIKTSQFDSNSVSEFESLGGAIYLSGNYTIIDSSLFDSNRADIGGSIGAESSDICGDCGPAPSATSTNKSNWYKSGTSSMMEPAYILDVMNSIFQRDSADYGGSISSFEYDTRVSGSIFQYNYADVYGGAIESMDSKYTGTNNLFAFNKAGIRGGAVATELCLICSQGPPTQLKSSTTTRRQHRDRGIRNSKKGDNQKSALLPENQMGISTFTNSTFAINSANAGSAISLTGTKDTISNCIIYDNFGDPKAVFYQDGASNNDTVYITHTLLEESGGSGVNWDNSLGIDGGGNIDQRPLFIDDDIPDPILGIIGNFRLEACSPAIDAGTFTPMLNPGSIDLDGNMRIQGGTVDMGAYEFPGFPITTRIYVDSAAVTGNNDGSSWEHAFLELSDAMFARCLEPGDTILVAKGTYLPDTTELMDPREASFPLRDLMVIIGGFNPAIGLDSIGEQSPFVQKSIMSGDIGIANDSLDNSYHIINNRGIALTSGTLIDGMHISHATANAMSFPNNNGGGMYNDNGVFDLANCTFEFNTASNAGGAMVNNGGTINIINCRFNDNISLGGAGVLQNNGVTIKVSNSSFIRNQGRFGGAIHNNSSSLKLSDSYFDQNESAFAGAAIFTSGSNDTIVQCVFVRGISATEGSAIKGVNTIIAINNNTFFDNQNTSPFLGSTGAAVNLSGDASGSITNNIIYGNKLGVPFSGSRPRENLSLSINDHSLVIVSNNIVGNLYRFSTSYPSFLGTDGGGNIDMDPQFLDTLNYDLRLSCNSPAIDAGREDTIGLRLTAFDLSDTTRFIGKLIDMGPYEAQGPCPDIEVEDVAFGEVCDTTTMSVYIKSDNIGDLIIDTIISSTPFFTFNLDEFNFPDTIPYCDSTRLDVSYNPTLSGVNTGTITIKSNALSGMNKIINLSGTLDTIPPMITCSDSTVYLDIDGMAAIDTSYFINTLSDNCGIDTVYLSRNMVSCSNFTDPVTITITAIDIHGNIQTCNTTLTVLDTIMPSLVTQSTTIYLDGDGMATLDTSQTISSVSDACGIDTVYISQAIFDCGDIASQNMVATTAIDVNGNISTSVSSVEVLDTVPPIMICQNIDLYLDASGNGFISATEIDNGSNDNCNNIDLSISRSEFNCNDVGAQIITLDAVDGSQNSSSCNATVTVIDTISPIVICTTASIYLDEMGMATLSPTMVDNGSGDACGIDTMYVSKADYNCSNTGDQSVTLTVVDNNNNMSTCTTTVTILDTISPVVLCTPATIYLDDNGMATLAVSDIDAGSTDNCLFRLAIEQSIFSCQDLGMNDIILTVTDSSQNVTTCTAVITVLDTIAPIVTCKNIDLYVDALGMATIDPSDILQDTMDNCAGITLSTDVSTLECPTGDKMVTLTATDISGNASSCSAVVTLIDTFPPVFTCRDTFIYLDNSGMAIIDESHVITSDDFIFEPCGISGFNFGPKEYDCSSVGVNQVIVGAIDASGNFDSCTFQLTVIDTIAPVVNCKNASIVIGNGGFAMLLLNDIENGSTDACGIAEYELSKETFTCADEGENEVVLTVTDYNGNTSSCTAIVTVALPITPYPREITGPAILCDTLTNLPYKVSGTEGDDLNFVWSYSGTGVTIKNNGSSEVLIDAGDITPGTLMVEVYTSCNGLLAEASLEISLGTPGFCALADCLQDFTFVSQEVLEIANSIDVYKAHGTIKSEAVIKAPRAIIFKAGVSVDLHPPFEVERGSVFVAEIEQCID